MFIFSIIKAARTHERFEEEQNLFREEEEKEEQQRQMLRNIGKENYRHLQDAAYTLSTIVQVAAEKPSVRHEIMERIQMQDSFGHSSPFDDILHLLLYADLTESASNKACSIRSGDKAGLALSLLEYALHHPGDEGLEYETALELPCLLEDYTITQTLDRLDSASIEGNRAGAEFLLGSLILLGEPRLEADYLRALEDFTAAIAGVPPQEDVVPDTTEGTFTALRELDALTGLQTVKDEFRSLFNLIRVNRLRREYGLKVPDMSYHLVFSGNPGTGKTTVARIVAKGYKELGILKKGHLVEADRSSLVAEYVGQTAVKTSRVIDSALDGVLFIDEAYTLAVEAENDFGKEAVATLLKRMEDDRDRLVVIIAGYTDEMQRFIELNPGLDSRFSRRIEFPDYDADELLDIFHRMCAKNDYILSSGANQKLKRLICLAVENKDRHFGNARYIRNLFEETLHHQADRLAAVDNLSPEMLKQIIEKDISLKRQSP